MTIIYDVPLGSGTSTAGLQSGGSTKYGILFGASSSLLGQDVKVWRTNLRQSGTPSGDITCNIYDSGSNIVATANETIDSTSLAVAPDWTTVTWTFTTARTILSTDRLVVEYSGAAQVIIEIYNTNPFDGVNTLRTRWNSGTSAWVNGTTEDVAGTIKDAVSMTTFDPTSFDSFSFDTGITLPRVSFSPLSFSGLSFTGGAEIPIEVPPPQPGGGKGKKKFRAWLKNLQKFVRRLFQPKKKKEEEPETIEEVELPPVQPPTTTTILAGPPETIEEAAQLETLNDHWTFVPQSVAAAVQPIPQPEVYPLILNPLSAPLIQTRVSLPTATKQPYIAPLRVGEGSHIESELVRFKKPINRSKVASTITTMMMLLEMDQRLSKAASSFTDFGVILSRRKAERATLPKRVRFKTQQDGKVDDKICLVLANQEWNIDDPDLIVPPDDTHPNCRCYLEEVIPEAEE